jgi:hypothetical protein
MIPEAFEFTFNLFGENTEFEGKANWYAEIADDTAEKMPSYAQPHENPDFHEAVLKAMRNEIDTQLDSIEEIKRVLQAEVAHKE